MSILGEEQDDCNVGAFKPCENLADELFGEIDRICSGSDCSRDKA